jgi:hypothetical protein
MPRMRHAKSRIMPLVAIAMLLALPALAQDHNSANFWQPKCKDVLRPNGGDVVSGACMGMMLVIKSTGHLLEVRCQSMCSKMAPAPEQFSHRVSI